RSDLADLLIARAQKTQRTLGYPTMTEVDVMLTPVLVKIPPAPVGYRSAAASPFLLALRRPRGTARRRRRHEDEGQPRNLEIMNVLRPWHPKSVSDGPSYSVPASALLII
ncbi:hypothetical protein THAOC_24507, partial [Thalassiosira oceanica]